MSIEEIVDTYLKAYCCSDEEQRRMLIKSVWNKEGRLIDPPLATFGHEGICKQTTQLLSQFPNHFFRRDTEVECHHEYATFSWTLLSPDGQIAVQGHDFLTLDVDGMIMSVVGFFGCPRTRVI